VLDRPFLHVSEIEIAQVSERLDWCRRSKRHQPGIEVLLHPVLEIDRAVDVMALAVVNARTDVPPQEILCRICDDDARDVSRCDDASALFLEGLDRLRHDGLLLRCEAPTRLRGTRHGGRVVEESPRNSDPRPLQSVALERRTIVAICWVCRRASLDRLGRANRPRARRA